MSILCRAAGPAELVPPDGQFNNITSGCWFWLLLGRRNIGLVPAVSLFVQFCCVVRLSAELCAG